jgi:hypothetical protein
MAAGRKPNREYAGTRARDHHGETRSKQKARMELTDIHEKLYPSAQGLKHLSFYLAHRPGATPEAFISWMTIDDIPVGGTRKTIELPGRQGWYINLAAFEEGREIRLAWDLRTESVPPGLGVVMGVFRDGRLTQRTVYNQQPLVLESFKSYPGTWTVKV